MRKRTGEKSVRMVVRIQVDFFAHSQLLGAAAASFICAAIAPQGHVPLLMTSHHCLHWTLLESDESKSPSKASMLSVRARVAITRATIPFTWWAIAWAAI